MKKEHILKWRQEIEKYLVDNSYLHILEEPSRVFNADEAAFFLNPKGNKVLVPRGSRCVYKLVNPNEKECLTVLMTGNAKGQVAPPLVLFAYERIPHAIAMKQPKENWSTGRSENGWMTCATFFEYMANVFHPWLVKEGIQLPVIFFVDGHSSHTSIHLSRFCEDNGIILICLCPNATHLIQPMDISVFKTLKEAWKTHVTDWRNDHPMEIFKKLDFSPLLEKAIKHSITPDVLRNGFRKAGLVPWCADNVDYNIIPDGPLDKTTESTSFTEESTSVTGKVRVVEEEIKIASLLEAVEKRIDEENLQIFKSNFENDLWPQNIQVENFGLFTLWSNIKREGTKYQDSVIGTGRNDHTDELLALLVENGEGLLQNVDTVWPINEKEDYIIEHGTSATTEIAATNQTASAGIEPADEIESLPIPSLEVIENSPSKNSPRYIMPQQLSKSDANINPSATFIIQNKPEKTVRTLVPYQNEVTILSEETSDDVSPFKKSFIFPVQIPTNKMRKLKEKVPSVVSSLEYQAWCQKKIDKKREEEEARIQRFQQRKERKEAKQKEKEMKKNKKTKKMTKKKTQMSDEESLDSDIDDPGMSAKDNLDDDDENESVKEVEENRYVIVCYEGEYYPGLITEKEADGAMVKTMEMAGPEHWKWPAKDDICSYKSSDIVMNIQPPCLKNARGMYYVKEIFAIRNKKKNRNKSNILTYCVYVHVST